MTEPITVGDLHLGRSFSCLIHPTFTPQYWQVCIKPYPFSFRALTEPLLPSFINGCHCLVPLPFYLVFTHSNRPSKDLNETMFVCEYSTFNIYSALFSMHNKIIVSCLLKLCYLTKISMLQLLGKPFKHIRWCQQIQLGLVVWWWVKDGGGLSWWLAPYLLIIWSHVSIQN